MFARYAKDTKTVARVAAPAPSAPKKEAAAAAPASAAAPAPAVASDPAKGEKRRARLADIKLQLHRELLEQLNLAALDKASERELREEIRAIMNEYLETNSIVVNRDDRLTLQDELFDEVVGLGPLEPLLKDDSIADILINGPQQIFVERNGKLTLSDVKFKDEKHLMRIL